MSPQRGRRSTAISRQQARNEDEATTYSPIVNNDPTDNEVAGGEPLGGMDPMTVGLALAGIYLAYRGFAA